MLRLIKIVRSSGIQLRIPNPIVIQRHGFGTSSGYDEEAVSEGEHGSKQDSGASTKDRYFVARSYLPYRDNFIMVAQDMGKIKADIGKMNGDLSTMKWQMGTLLVAVVGFGGTLLGCFIKRELFDGPKQPKIPEQPKKPEQPMQLNVKEFMSLVEDMKAITSTLKTMTDADTRKNV